MFTIPDFLAAPPPRTFKRLDCPHCGEQLNRHARLVVATRNCPACGRRVVAEPEGEGPPPLSRQQFEDACAAYARTHGRVARLFLAGFLLFFASVVPLALYRDTIRDAIGPVADPGLVFLLVMFGPCGLIFLAALVRLDRATRAGLKCPHCAAPCSVTGSRCVNLTRLTGNCAGCGRKLLNDPPPEEAPGPLPTVEEFKAIDRRATKGDWSLLAPFAALVAMMAGLSALGPDRFWPAFEARYGILNGTLILTGLICGWALVAGAVSLVSLRWALRRQARKRAAEPMLNCPHCNAVLVNALQVVASQRCPACRTRVLVDPEPAPAASGG